MVYMRDTKRLVAGKLVMHFLTENVIIINKDGLFYKAINRDNLINKQQMNKDMVLAVAIEDIVDKCNEDIDREEVWKFIMERGNNINE